MAEPVFRGKVALVTGAAGGIGFATARAFAEAGADVALLDVDETGVLNAAEELNATGYKALGMRCDIAQRPMAGLRRITEPGPRSTRWIEPIMCCGFGE